MIIYVVVTIRGMRKEIVGKVDQRKMQIQKIHVYQTTQDQDKDQNQDKRTTFSIDSKRITLKNNKE